MNTISEENRVSYGGRHVPLRKLSRRDFMERLGVGTLAGGVSVGLGVRSAEGGVSWTPPPVLSNPNILIIMVDQMRFPAWLSPTTLALNQYLPNIIGRIRRNSYTFSQYFTAATTCTPSRATLLTGLYTPQTAMYITGTIGIPSSQTPLNTAYPTWGHAVRRLNPAYKGHIWWFGKWHLSNQLNAAPLAAYGFRTRTYPGGATAPYNPSPDGAPNEGTDGGPFGTQVYASDAMIAGDFIGWLEAQAPIAESTPWCATVSLINPHDIHFAAGWLQDSPFPPPGLPVPSVYFPPPGGSPAAFYTAEPSPWNYEDLPNVPNKPSLQLQWKNNSASQYGAVTNWLLFLNQYFWLQNFVDQQVGKILDALQASPFAHNTIVIFLSDHGEYGGSHGLHSKGYGAYDEAIHVPFFVQFPGQSAQFIMNQMCSSVDFFGLICDLATGGGSHWMQTYPDLAERQSMWNFLYHNSSETRIAPAPVSLPYILHTFEAEPPYQYAYLTCLRTKLNSKPGTAAGKLVYYADWAPCTTYPDSTPPQVEFYDYSSNTAEIGNDYPSTNTQSLEQVIGSWGPPGTGIIGSELNKPLIGTGRDGKPLTEALAAAQYAYYQIVNPGVCSVSGKFRSVGCGESVLLG